MASIQLPLIPGVPPLRMEEANDFVVRSLVTGERWETTALQFWSETVAALPSGAVVLDIGAYTGIYALIAGTLRSDLHVLAFEPLSSNFARLEHNVSENELTNVRCLRQVVSDVSGEAVLKVSGDSRLPSGSSLSDHETRPTLRTETIAAVTIDSLDIERIGLIKIDVEHHELAVLRGMEGVLRRDRPTILIELLSDREFSQAIQWLRECGYATVFVVNETSQRLEPVHEFTRIGTNFVFIG